MLQVLSSHQRQQIVRLYLLQDRDSMTNWYAFNHPTTLQTHIACCLHFAQWNVYFLSHHRTTQDSSVNGLQSRLYNERQHIFQVYQIYSCAFTIGPKFCLALIKPIFSSSCTLCAKHHVYPQRTKIRWSYRSRGNL